MDRRPASEWARRLAGVLGERLSLIDLPPAERTELERQLGRFAEAAPIQQLLADRLRDASAPSAARRSSLQAMAWSDLKAEAVPREWVDALAGVLEGDPATPSWSHRPWRPCAPCLSPGRRPVTCQPVCSGSPATPGTPPTSGSAPWPPYPGDWSIPIRISSRFLIGQLDREQTVASRTTAADVLARAKLTAEQLVRLADALRTAGPVEVDRLLAAFEQSADESLGFEAH